MALQGSAEGMGAHAERCLERGSGWEQSSQFPFTTDEPYLQEIAFVSHGASGVVTALFLEIGLEQKSHSGSLASDCGCDSGTPTHGGSAGTRELGAEFICSFIYFLYIYIYFFLIFNLGLTAEGSCRACCPGALLIRAARSLLGSPAPARPPAPACGWCVSILEVPEHCLGLCPCGVVLRDRPGLSCWDPLMGVEFPPSSHEQIFFLGKISRTWSPWPDSRLVSSAHGKLFYRVALFKNITAGINCWAVVVLNGLQRGWQIGC